MCVWVIAVFLLHLVVAVLGQSCLLCAGYYPFQWRDPLGSTLPAHMYKVIGSGEFGCFEWPVWSCTVVIKLGRSMGTAADSHEMACFTIWLVGARWKNVQF